MPIKSSGELSESQVIARCPQVTAVNQDSSFIHGHAIFERKADGRGTLGILLFIAGMGR